jgi:hypothetical protein
MNKGTIPHLQIVVAVSSFVLLGFAAVSGYVLVFTGDEVSKGNIIATWQNFALLAVGFWIGSSSGGKSRGEADGNEPSPVRIEQPAGEPVPVQEAKP